MTQNRLFISAALCLLYFLGGCSTQPRSAIDQLWPQTVSPYIQEALWQPKLNYDAANILMLPLHHAFSSRGTPRQREEFDVFFARFAQNAQINFDTNTLRNGQFSYLVARYLVLSAQMDIWSDTHEQLRRQLLATTEFYWFYRIRYDILFRHRFAGHAQRLRWKLKKQQQPLHASALVDDEFFTMAIASDLASLRFLKSSKSEAKSEMLDKILTQTCETIQQAGQFNTQGGWQLQLGVWADHKDYAYTGHKVLKPGLTPKPTPGVDQDSSHAHRFPLWFISFQSASTDPTCIELYAKIRQGISKQLQQKVWKSPDERFSGPRLTNFFDGHNGLYRYGYKTKGNNLGYAPWQLSGVVATGWYAFVDTDWMRNDFVTLSDSFPLPDRVKKTYIGPDTTRYRHPLIAANAFWTNGFAELEAHIAASLTPNSYVLSRSTND